MDKLFGGFTCCKQAAILSPKCQAPQAACQQHKPKWTKQMISRSALPILDWCKGSRLCVWFILRVCCQDQCQTELGHMTCAANACISTLLVRNMDLTSAAWGERWSRSSNAAACPMFLGIGTLNAIAKIGESESLQQRWKHRTICHTLFASNKRSLACSWNVQPPLLRGVWGY